MNITTIGTYKIFTFVSNVLSSFSTVRPELSTIYGLNDAGTAYRSYNAATGGGTLGTDFKPNSGYLLITRYPNNNSISIVSNQTFNTNISSIRIDKTYTFLTYPFSGQRIATYRNSLCAVYGFNAAETAYRSYNAATGGGTLGTVFASNSGYLIQAREPFDLINPEWPYVTYDDFNSYGLGAITSLSGGLNFFANGQIITNPGGTYIIYDTFADYEIGGLGPSGLSGGAGFLSDGVFLDNVAIAVYDDFADYGLGTIITLSGGVGFASRGAFIQPQFIVTYDDFADYGLGTIITLSGGVGFALSGAFIDL